MSLRNTNFTFEEIHQIYSRSKKLFFIGIGGISMSGIAEFCARDKREIYGYDKSRSRITEALEKVAKIKYYSTPDNVRGMDMVIYTNAIDEHNFEYRRAKKLKLPLISRANFLGYLLSLHKTKIGVCGMHGKSTTTALLTHIFDYGCKKPTAFCGAEMNGYGKSCLAGEKDLCIFEACEYTNSFLSFPTTDAVVLNVDFDHPDFFESLDDVKKSFQKYVNNAHRVFLNGDDPGAMSLTHDNIITFGFDKSSTYRGEIIKAEADPFQTTFMVYRCDVPIAVCTLPLLGKHFVSDALAAFAVAHMNGVPTEAICQAINDFRGSKKRMEFIKKSDTGADIYEDYAHHPAEIEASLSALKEMGYKRILCVFQAHTYSRTYYLYERFTRAFELAEHLIIAPIFPAREENIYELSEEQFALDCGGEYIEKSEEIAHRVKKTLCDAIVLMGAGDLSAKMLPRLC